MITRAKHPNPFIEKFVRLGDVFERCLISVGTVIVMGYVLSVFTDVLFRTFFSPIVWMQEMSLFGYMWAILLGASIAFRRGTHFKIDILTSAIKNETVLLVFRILSYIICCVFVYVLLYYGWRFAMSGYNKFSQPSGIRTVYFRLCFPISGFFMTYYAIEGIICSVYSVFHKGAPAAAAASEEK